MSAQLEISHKDLLVLAHMAGIGTSIMSQQLLTGNVPENETPMVQAMISDANAVLNHIRKIHEQMSQEHEAQDESLAEMGKPAVGNVQ